MFKRFIILLFLFPLFSFMRMNDSVINVSNIDSDKLENLILEKVNALRKSKKRSHLTKNNILGNAAQDHANFLKDKKALSHNQRSKGKKTPMNRVDFYKGNFNYVGENVAFTYLNEPVQGVKNKSETKYIKTYEQAAQHFFELWKYSKPHYKNLIDKDFTMSSLRFCYDKKSKRIYGVQVFGAY